MNQVIRLCPGTTVVTLKYVYGMIGISAAHCQINGKWNESKPTSYVCNADKILVVWGLSSVEEARK